VVRPHRQGFPGARDARPGHRCRLRRSPDGCRTPDQDQAEVFYDSLITGIDPDATITYEFAGA
jgi:hypothetical protein